LDLVLWQYQTTCYLIGHKEAVMKEKEKLRENKMNV
jgi:hypothetical protein